MKFSDGNWMMLPGVRAHYATEVYEADEKDGGLDLLVPTRKIRHRGDTLEGPVLTVRISSPMPDVVRIQSGHFLGSREPKPSFELEPQPHFEPETEITDDFVRFKTGVVEAKIDRTQDFRIEFFANELKFAETPNRGLAKMELSCGRTYAMAQLNLTVGEQVFGLGERFTSLIKNGQTVEIWNKDGGTGSDQAYKNIPFYLTNKGYGVFVNDPGQVSFEVATEKVSRVQFSLPGERIDYFVIYGPTPKEILQKYTALTGRATLPPAWTFGLWLTTSFTTNYDEKTVTEFVDGMAERNLPLHVFHFDCFWMRDFHWCDFEWDKRVFPDPPAMLKRLKEKGLKICVWINPYIAQRSSLFEEAVESGFLLKKPNGEVWQTDQWQPGMGIVDFTNPEAIKWYQSKLKTLVDMGVDSFKTDFGERIPTDVVWHDGSDPERMHNYYPYLYNKAVFETIPGSCVFARSATVGCQKFPVHWGGDCDSKFESMAESLRGGLSLGMSGFGFWSHDIGGFEGLPNASLYKRWLAFGLMSSHSRLHGSSSYRVPWLIDEESCDVLRHFTKLKCRLMPYLYAKAIEATETGVPMMRSMLLEFPDDPTAPYLDRQYMLGDSLLVAPVFDSLGDCEFYLPEGTWTELATSRVVEGPCWLKENYGFLEMPIWVRPGTVLVIGEEDERPDYDFSLNPRLYGYALEPNQIVDGVVPNLDGSICKTFRVECTLDSISTVYDGQEYEIEVVS